MYEELVGDLRYCGKGDCNGCRRYTKDTRYCNALLRDAADAIEERDKYALTIQHEMMAEAESHIALVERLNKQIEELTLIAESNERSAAMWAETAGKAVEQIPRWIPVAEELPNYNVPVLVTYIGYNDGVPHCDCTAYIQEPLLESMDGEWHWCESYRKVNVQITHWQALPEPATEAGCSRHKCREEGR